MTAALSIFAAVIGLVVYLIRRRLGQQDDPVYQRAQKEVQISKDIAQGDGVDAGSHLVDDLDELDRLLLRKGDPKR